MTSLVSEDTGSGAIGIVSQVHMPSHTICTMITQSVFISWFCRWGVWDSELKELPESFYLCVVSLEFESTQRNSNPCFSHKFSFHRHWFGQSCSRPSWIKSHAQHFLQIPAKFESSLDWSLTMDPLKPESLVEINCTRSHSRISLPGERQRLLFHFLFNECHQGHPMQTAPPPAVPINPE